KEKAEEVLKKEEEKKQIEAQAVETNVPPDVDTLELQVGYGIVNLVEGEGKGDLIDRIFQIRKEFAKELGIIVPKVRIKDNLELQPAQYSLLIKGVPVGGGELLSGYVLAMDSGNVEEPVPGIETKEPVFGLPALWIPEKLREKAQMDGYTVVDASTIVATHLTETIRRHASELIGRQELQSLVDNLSKSHPKVVEEAIGTNAFNLGSVLKVCKGLLKEQVPIRDLRTILETLANYAATTKDTDQLVEFVRTALARTITNRLSGGTGALEVMTMSPATEEQIIRAYQRQDNGSPTLNMEPGYFERLVKSLNKTLESTVFNSGTPVLLCRPMIRGLLKKAIERFVPNLQIVSANDISPDASVKIIATVEA
ncbi:MAG: EscV/YscV/HrcV family type III secretion system export apparatus protein, partial [Proteobacteria bacterium]|nr:EscV/YscV/HrcV family type III secretion system export apparatus protein [Pseudomonadota bacterium]